MEQFFVIKDQKFWIVTYRTLDGTPKLVREFQEVERQSIDKLPELLDGGRAEFMSGTQTPNYFVTSAPHASRPASAFVRLLGKQAATVETFDIPKPKRLRNVSWRGGSWQQQRGDGSWRKLDLDLVAIAPVPSIIATAATPVYFGHELRGYIQRDGKTLQWHTFDENQKPLVPPPSTPYVSEAGAFRYSSDARSFVLDGNRAVAS